MLLETVDQGLRVWLEFKLGAVSSALTSSGLYAVSLVEFAFAADCLQVEANSIITVAAVAFFLYIREGVVSLR